MKVTTLSKLKKVLKPHTATLVQGAFDLFHVGHLRYLKKCSAIGRPLIVIVQSNKTVRIRKGFNRPIISEKHRAEIIAALDFVDYVLILDKPLYNEKYLNIIRPKNFVFSKETMNYRKSRQKLINDKFPDIKVIFLEKSLRNYSTSLLVKKLLAKRDYSKIKNLITRRLYEISDQGKSTIGRISALIASKGKIVAASENIEGRKESLHAEHMVIEDAKSKGINLKSTKLYVLIPPCIFCAREIVENKIPEVYYLHSYGNDDGVTLLRKHGIKIKKLTN